MEDCYLYHYILSYFDLKNVSTISQILHVFHAKRTPSMFYLIEVRRWHHGFSLFKNMTREQLTKIVEDLNKKSFLTPKEKGYVLTEKGFTQHQNYFKEHYFPRNIHHFIHSNIRIPFWNRWQLFTQVFSEFSFNNTHYIPVVKHPHHQENVRLLFQRFNADRDQLLKRWIMEQHFIFKHLEENFGNLLMNQFTGHQWIGKTREQIAEFYGMHIKEFNFYMLDAIEAVLQLIEENSEKLPLHQAIVTILHEETNWGLSASTFITYQMLEEEFSISQIAQQRAIKKNTVKEHILEIAFTFDRFPYQKFVPSEIYKQLHHLFEMESDFTYQTAVTQIDGLEFMHYRLVELERMRSNDK